MAGIVCGSVGGACINNFTLFFYSSSLCYFYAPLPSRVLLPSLPSLEKKNIEKKKNICPVEAELALKSIPHPGIFGGFGRNVFFLQYGDFIKKPEVLILLSKTTT